MYVALENLMSRWIICTRKGDDTPIYIDLDSVRWMRWNENEDFTALYWAGGEENVVRVRETPEEIFYSMENDET